MELIYSWEYHLYYELADPLCQTCIMDVCCMEEINQARFSVAINAVAAIMMGWASVVLTAMSRTLVAGVAGIIVMVIVGFITQKAVKNADRKWWLSNGVVVFLLVWLVSWTTFKNLGA